MTRIIRTNRKTGAYSQPWDTARIPNLRGKVAIVTGANSPDSMGFYIAYHLAIKGAKVYIGARTEDKARKAVDEMLKKSAGLQLGTFVADLGDMKQVINAIRKFTKIESRLDILVNNATLMNHSNALDENGISKVFAVNHLGPFLLTTELLPLMKTAAADPLGTDTRVVVVASEAFRAAPPGARFRNTDDFNLINHTAEDLEFLHYNYSKLANVLFARQLQKELYQEGGNIIAISLHPGLVATGGARGFLGDEGIEAVKEASITLEQGSHTALFAATDPIVREKKGEYSGAYLIPFGTIDELSPAAQDEELAKELWESSERIIGAILGS